MRRALAATLVILTAAGCGARTTSPVPHPVPPAAMSAGQALRHDLHQIFTDPVLDHASWGVNFESLRTGESLFGLDDKKFLLPASTQKLFTAAVAAERLGWDYRFATSLWATGPIDADGTLQGDLMVTGHGDPTINPRHDNRWRVFESWAEQLHQRGIRAIAGRIIGNDDDFEEPGLGQGWSWDNLPYGYGTAIGALQFNENQVLVSVAPGAAGSTPVVTVMPAFHGMSIETRAATAPAGTTSSIDIFRLPGSRVLQIRGKIAADAKPVSVTASVDNPTQLYVNALKATLTMRGISVRGDAVDIDDIFPPLDIERATHLLEDNSPPLSEIIDVCLKWSRNEYAETLLRAIAHHDVQPKAAQDALEVMRTTLGSWGISADFVVPVDGSGLSRQDYVTAHALTLLLTYVWMEPTLADTFRSTLPVAGVSGTLAERMKGTPLEGRVWAKTGTLSNVRGLSGYLLTRSGEPVAFSMLSNNFQVPTAEIDGAMERALLRVFEYERSQ